jgi:hypothetical protein
MEHVIELVRILQAHLKWNKARLSFLSPGLGSVVLAGTAYDQVFFGHPENLPQIGAGFNGRRWRGTRMSPDSSPHGNCKHDVARRRAPGSVKTGTNTCIYYASGCG